MTKEEIKILEDMQGYIQFEIDHDEEDTRLTHVLGTLGHDIGGILHKDDCFSPRTHGYSKCKTPILVDKSFIETERGNLWITQAEEGYHLSYALLRGNPEKHDEEMTLLESSVTPCNYPGLNVSVVSVTPNDLAKHINKQTGWFIKKLNLVPDGSVKDCDGYII